eukprot:TRINITY_DN24682_c1_g1_i1.p1 TRINITY_DN24682_c1_g1~~TRINITY_DN24682_c1_g1_i1.p1  ORF type:complete len:305 (+),score=12.61 TRINITY_DN24682_c1_g1_i1:573-1487(+)
MGCRVSSPQRQRRAPFCVRDEKQCSTIDNPFISVSTSTQQDSPNDVLITMDTGTSHQDPPDGGLLAVQTVRSLRRDFPGLRLDESQRSLESSACTVWTPAPGRVCVVLDFDLTMAACHVHKELRRLGFGYEPTSLGRSQIFGPPERQKALREFLLRLKSLKVHIAVLTNNSEAVVRSCLQIGGLDDLVDDIVAVEQDKGRDIRKLRPAGITQWVFVDDEIRNIRSVLGATRERVPCVLVDGGCGLQQRHMDQVIKLATSSLQFLSPSASVSTLEAVSPTSSMMLPMSVLLSETRKQSADEVRFL